MWPFQKKTTKPKAATAFQEWRRSYKPPKAPPITNPIQVETICPLCFDRFPPGAVSSDYPSCPDCASEGMDFDVEPLAQFLATKSAQDFDSMYERWESAEGFLPAYKALKLDRIQQLKALKLAQR